jgi:hypothetical protein
MLRVAQAVVGNLNCLRDQNGKYSIREIIEIARGGNKIEASSPRFRRNRRIKEWANLGVAAHRTGQGRPIAGGSGRRPCAWYMHAAARRNGAIDRSSW